MSHENQVIPLSFLNTGFLSNSKCRGRSVHDTREPQIAKCRSAKQCIGTMVKTLRRGLYMGRMTVYNRIRIAGAHQPLVWYSHGP